MSIAEKILTFYKQLDYPEFLPEGVEVMDPYRETEAMNYCTLFYNKYYNDNNKRVLLLGINPGRFGGGITGIPFTDPAKLENICKIPNTFDKREELSSTFIYDMINYLGGPEMFYSRFYISAVSPIGFVKNGKNLNYYEDTKLKEKWEPFMVDALKQQLDFCDNTEVFSIGMGKNIQFLNTLNKKHKLFGNITALPHPRWVMQYRLKRKQEFIDEYGDKLNSRFSNGDT